MAPEPAEGDLALACASLLVDELARCGSRDACVSPGSRSTPLTLAVARHPALRVHVHLDERSAAYAALGMAQATGLPTLVVATSGTAVANWLPATVEADMAEVPLVLLSADRPPELRDTQANQAIDQHGIFASHVRWFCDAGTPQALPHAARYWRSLGCRVHAQALGPPRGPVHLNLPFREPLVPSGNAVDLGVDAGGRPDAEPWERTSPPLLVPSSEDATRLAEEISATERGLIVAGSLPAHACHRWGALAELATKTAWPLIAEPTSQLRTGPPALCAGSLLLGSQRLRRRLDADLVLQFGAAPLSRAVLEAVVGAPRLVTVGARTHPADPGRTSSWSLRCEPDALARALLPLVEQREQTEWLQVWKAADAGARRAADECLDSWAEPTEGRTCRDLAATIPEGAALLVASSMPIRELDSHMSSRSGITVFANRGASGIDGLVSTAVGIAAVHSPTYALLGDLAFLHDAGAFLWAAREAPDLVLVIIDNGGGRIFDLLPQVALPEHELLFTTPHRLELARIVNAAGAWHRLVSSAADLAPALEDARVQKGVRVVQVDVDAARNGERHQMIAGAIERAAGAIISAA